MRGHPLFDQAMGAIPFAHQSGKGGDRVVALDQCRARTDAVDQALGEPPDRIGDQRIMAVDQQLARATRIGPMPGQMNLADVAACDRIDPRLGVLIKRVGRCARRRYPALPSLTSTPDDRKPVQSPSAALPAPREETEHPDPPPASAAVCDEAADAAWHAAVEGAVRRAWGADVPADVALHAARWRAEGRDLARDVLPAIVRVVGVAVEFNRPFRLEEVTWAMAGAPIANHSNRAA